MSNNIVVGLFNGLQNLLDKFRALDFLGPLALRLYLAPVFWVAANNKWNPLDSNSSLQDTINWFGNKEWGLGLPYPDIMAHLAWGTEYFGAILLLIGFATRWVCIPLMATMLVAIFKVHWVNGWQAINDLKATFPDGHAGDALERLSRAKDILQEHGNYDWLTEYGNLVSLNNGIEWGATYFIMILALFFIGAGKYFSLDYWFAAKFRNE